MDTLRGTFGYDADLGDGASYDPAEDETGRETPPLAIGQDERRMQVRAYNHWASLLHDRQFPLIDDLDPGKLPDFGPYSVLLDFTAGIDNPGIAYLGEELAEECGAVGRFERLSDVPSRSLLSRITDHYMQIIANQAPIGFEAEFVNQAGRTILYRGILLPYSSDDARIDYIFGVINWKELADQFMTDELLLEIDQALAPDAPDGPITPRQEDNQLTDWADGPAADPLPARDDDVLELALAMAEPAESGHDLPGPVFGEAAESILSTDTFTAPLGELDDDDGFDGIDINLGSAEEMGLGDWLASARELALAASRSDDRTRQALYAAIGRAYDFSLAAASEPEEFAELVASSGLSMQDRAPMTPVVKLVFGADYDKTRLTEYAAVLSHGHRLSIGYGEFTQFLETAKGGLKAVIAAERRLRREESGKASTPADAPRERLARKLRRIEPTGFEALAQDGGEFGLVLIRRLPEGDVTMLGEIPEDMPLLERAARKLLARK